MRKAHLTPNGMRHARTQKAKKTRDPTPPHPTHSILPYLIPTHPIPLLRIPPNTPHLSLRSAPPHLPLPTMLSRRIPSRSTRAHSSPALPQFNPIPPQPLNPVRPTPPEPIATYPIPLYTAAIKPRPSSVGPTSLSRRIGCTSSASPLTSSGISLALGGGLDLVLFSLLRQLLLR